MKAFSRAAILYATVSLLGSVIVGWKLVDVFAARPRVSLPSYGHVPAFRLVDHRGQPISDESLRGTVWVADFIFTRCAGQCPMMSERLAQLDHALGADARLKLISFTVDPDWEYQIKEQFYFDRLERKPPDLIWQACRPLPLARVESGCVQLGDQLYIVGGYSTLDQALSEIAIFDLRANKWSGRFPMPSDVPQTHQGICSDKKRYIFLLSGQLGPQCSPSVLNCFTLDVQERRWLELPPLPEPRYAPVAQFCNERIYVCGGTREDRWTLASDHWSLGIAEGRPLERQWRRESSIPRGGMHRASTVTDEKIYVFGGQEGDVKPYPHDPKFMCNWSTPLEQGFPDCFCYDVLRKTWAAIAPLPVPLSHTEAAVINFGRNILVGGGHLERYTYHDQIYCYDREKNEWRAVGLWPDPIKGFVFGYFNGWLYVITGQRSKSMEDLGPGETLRSTWRTRFKI